MDTPSFCLDHHFLGGTQIFGGEGVGRSSSLCKGCRFLVGDVGIFCRGCNPYVRVHKVKRKRGTEGSSQGSVPTEIQGRFGSPVPILGSEGDTNGGTAAGRMVICVPGLEREGGRASGTRGFARSPAFRRRGDVETEKKTAGGGSGGWRRRWAEGEGERR